MRLPLHLGKRQRALRVLWIGACAVTLLALSGMEILGENGYWARRERRQQMQALREDIQNLEQENQRLAQQVQELRSDPRAIEEMAREQLRLARPGEFIISLQPSPEPPAVTDPAPMR